MMKLFCFFLVLIILGCNANQTKKIVSTIHEPGFYSVEFDTISNQIHLQGVATNDTLDSLRFFLTIPSMEELKSNQLTFVGKMPFKSGKSVIKLADIDSTMLFIKNIDEIHPNFRAKFNILEKKKAHKFEADQTKALMNYFPEKYINFTVWLEVGVTNGSLESDKGKETKLGFYALNNQNPIEAKPKDALNIFQYKHIVSVE